MSYELELKLSRENPEAPLPFAVDLLAAVGNARLGRSEGRYSPDHSPSIMGVQRVRSREQGGS